MTKHSRKCKMISLRLTEGEYDALHMIYPIYGVRSISDLARLALQSVIGNSHGSDRASSSNVPTMQDLSRRVNTLEAQLGLLMEREKTR